MKNTKYKVQNTKEGTGESSIRDSILADIHTNHIRPRPRWQYIFLHIGLWSSVIVTLILGAFACAFMFLEFSLPERVYLHWVESQDNWFLALPYLWGIGMIFVLTLGYFVFSKTGKSYRYRAGVVVGILVLGSFIGGAFLYFTHTIHWSDKQIQRFEPRYRQMREGFIGVLPRPEDGVLPLRIDQIDDNTIRGKTPDGQPWSVTLLCHDGICEENKSRMRTGRPSVFQGEVTSQGVFEASRVLPGPGFRPKNLHPIPKDIRGNTSAKKGE